MNKPSQFASLLTSYLSEYLPGQRNLSSNTIRSYRDTFRLLLQFCRDEKHLKIEKLDLRSFDEQLIKEFLAWLERERHCSVSTRNQRLAALHAFFRYVQIEAPECMTHAIEILGIPFKRGEKPNILFLSPDALKLLLAQPDVKTARGRRDLALMSLLYDTGARVQELCDLRVRDLRLETPAIVTLVGKGRKMRHVPLMTNTAKLLTDYISERKLDCPARLDHPLFFNPQRNQLTRAGVTYVVKKYAEQARQKEPVFLPERISPHVLRHTKAMHLLQANVNLIYIRDLLGHVDVATTEIYARADTEMKRRALENAYPDLVPENLPAWNRDSDLMAWLKDFCNS